MNGPIENAQMAVMKWIVLVRHPCILNVTINTVFHPGGNVMVSMIVMICRMKIIVLVVLVSMDDFWILYLFILLYVALSLYYKNCLCGFPLIDYTKMNFVKPVSLTWKLPLLKTEVEVLFSSLPNLFDEFVGTQIANL